MLVRYPVNIDDTYSYMPRSSDYGTGVYRRRVRLVGAAGVVRAEMEDCLHGMRCSVHHADGVITDIQSEMLRVPISTCGGAVQPIRALVGQRVDLDERELGQIAGPRRNCTHLLDLALLAIAHIRRGAGVRQYDVAITDETEQGTIASVRLDNALVHEWRIAKGAFVEPGRWAGQPVLQGFAKWAGAAYRGDELEAARVLQKGYFVACARFYDVGALDGKPSAGEKAMLGSCHSYSPGVVEHAVRNHKTVRDFTHREEALLRFL